MLGYGHMENRKNLWGSNGQCGGLQSHYNNTVSVIHYWMSLQRRTSGFLMAQQILLCIISPCRWLLGDRNKTVFLLAVLEQELELRFALALAPTTGLKFAFHIPARHTEQC